MSEKASYFGLLFGSQREGFLTKRGKIRKNWKRRWFVLKDDVLYYFENTTDPQPKGNITVKNASMGYADDETKKQHSFKIIRPERTLYLFADTKEEMDEWMNAIEKKL